MTGFGLGVATLGLGRVAAEVRAVNGRFLDVRVRMPAELSGLSVLVESETRKRLARGRCDITVRLEGSVFSAQSIDKERARRAYALLTELRDELAPGADVPFSMISVVPDLFKPAEEGHLEPARDALRVALAAALDGLELMRQKEGRAIADDLLARMAVARTLVDQIAARSPELFDLLAKRFRQRLVRLWPIVFPPLSPTAEPDRDPPIDPARVEQELVLMLERSDISEELLRLKSHLSQMATYVEEDEPLGRRLDFLLQEMAREINTIGAKSQDLGLSHTVVELKAEIERMREQVQNVE